MDNLSENKSVRLESLDFLRGLIMVLLVLDSTGCYEYIQEAIANKESFGFAIISQFFHIRWRGIHFWDLVQPLFMFMAGIAMTYSLSKQTLRKDKFIKIAKRSALLLFFGLFKRIHSPEWLSLETLDVTDILTQLAFTTLIAFFLFDLKIKYQLFVCFCILLLTDFLYRFCSVPGFNQGYTEWQNFGNYVDWLLFGQKPNEYVFINWLPTAVHTVAGTVVGKIIIDGNRQLRFFLLSGIALLIVGYGLDFLNVIPIIKRIATASFVTASMGFCFLFLLLSYWWIDVRLHKKGLLFFHVFGMNSIFIYLFSEIVGRNWLNGYVTIIVTPLFKMFCVADSLILVFASLCVFTVEWYVCFILYQKRLFFKL
ncbi:hypothetical protein FEDK69T_05520 [Flavobacterium enshiense DK69]|uniref:Uncharacterized protein n=1 Tax=Flavobacterium enshiense DK69 TaxID=1107311 RepID=V6SJL9_9FLAO|nr:DUF5009 domain-containing protein [Flavobacterium enshiense]ESU24630.1 hypothetical protein FEDK69T_05520 [Flavobacterium enshiense DK69]KGO95503.1 hypothetical protein Q767_11935 [Flavobacterium enshiense DK69]